MVGTLDQQTSKIRVASLGDAELQIALAGLAAFWSRAKIAPYVSTSTESRLISERQDECERSDMADPMNRHHGLGLGVLGLSQALDLPVIMLDLLSHVRDLDKDWAKRQLQPRR
jgi:hypothetical protein